MPKLKLQGLEEVSIMIRQMAENADEVAKAAVYAGADAAADAVRREIQALPTESGNMPEGEKRKIVKPTEKQALLDHMGISHIQAEGGKVSAAVGFDGYAEELATDKYPKGLPVPLLV